MLYIVQFYEEQHTGARCESPKQESLASVLSHDEKARCLHKINNFIQKDTEYKYFGCQTISSERFTLFLGRLWRQSQYISAMSETQGCGVFYKSLEDLS